MNLQECMEKHNILIGRDQDSFDTIIIEYYGGTGHRLGTTYIEDNNYGKPGANWLREALADCEDWNGYPDTVVGFAAYCANCGCPVIEADFWAPKKSERKYTEALSQNANWWEYVRELRSKLIDIFGVDLYHELVEAAEEE